MLRIRLALVVAVLAVVTPRAHAASTVDPALHFRTLTTAHFVIYFHQGEDRLAARLAAIAEDAWPKVSARLGVRAPRRTHVILADQSEIANGFATPLPYDTIFLTAAAPPGSDYIGRTDDWLRLVFSHEFTHIVHLDRSEGWARIVRAVFGRTSIAFPNTFLPIWQIEGLAAYEESALAGAGRAEAFDFLTIEQEAARFNRFSPLDRANGGLTDWPAGNAPYAYGLGFHEYLAMAGEEQFAQLAAKTSRSLPYFGSRAYRSVYGKSLGELWKDYERFATSQSRRYGIVSPEINPYTNTPTSFPTRLTHEGFMVLGPRFARPTCAGCQPEIIYSVRNPDGFPALKAVNADGSHPHQLTLRYLGSTAGTSDRLIVFDQQQLQRNVGLYSDLYALDRASGAVRRLTSHQRLQDPDLSPDGQTIVSVRQVAGGGEIVLGGLTPNRTHRTLVSDENAQFYTPRWSPDGRLIAAERRRLGSLSEIVIVDAATGAIRVLASHPDLRYVTPTWRPDGAAIVASVEGSTPFNLVEFTLEAPLANGRPLTDVHGAALWPDFSPDGKTIAFVGYTADGFDLFSQPYVPFDNSYTIEGESSKTPRQTPIAAAESVPGQIKNYSAWPTLPPTSWFPIVETGDQLRAGAAVNGADVLGRHAYAIAATWLVEAPANAVTTRSQVPDWDVSYAYNRWQPVFFASASRHTLFGAGPADDEGRPTPATLRRREIEGGVLLPFRRVRSTRQALFSMLRTDDRYTFTNETPTVARTATRLGLASTTARLYGYSVSPEDGYAVGATAEIARDGLGSNADETTLTADGRLYLPGLARHHTVAIRGAAGSSKGTAGGRRIFLMGGAAPAVDVLNFSRDAISLMRGFPSDSFAGTHAALLNADYRFPIARPQRGVGTWPLFLHTVHAALFADIGETWTNRFRSDNLKTSVGGEFALNVIAGYSFPFTAALGAAWGHDGTDKPNRGTAYIRIGRAF